MAVSKFTIVWFRFFHCVFLASIFVIFFTRSSLAAPTLNSVTPSSGFQGATLNLTITGSGFASSGATVRIGAGVTVNSIRVVDANSIVANVTLPADPGIKTITVESGGASTSLPFEILSSQLSNPQNVAVSHLTGPEGGLGTNDGRGTDARFYSPTSIWSDGANLFVADTYAQTIRKIVIATRDVTTLAGAPGKAGYVDAAGPNARFNVPNAIWGDGTNLYVLDNSCLIRKIVIATAEVTTFLGVKNGCSLVDGTPDVARLRGANLIWGDGESLYVVEYGFTTPQPMGQYLSTAPAIRVISLRTRQVRSIQLPLFSCCLRNPMAIWGTGGYLYTSWSSYPGPLALARVNITGGAVEWLFNSSPSGSLSPPGGLWFDGRDTFYFVQGTTVRRLVLSTGEMSSIADIPLVPYAWP